MIRFLLDVAWRSAWSRRLTLSLVVCSIALSTFMLLGVERIRTDLRDNFTSAVSGTDLIVDVDAKSRDGNPRPLVLFQRAGRGMVLFHTTDETWRWRWRVGGVLGLRRCGLACHGLLSPVRACSR